EKVAGNKKSPHQTEAQDLLRRIREVRGALGELNADLRARRAGGGAMTDAGAKAEQTAANAETKGAARGVEGTTPPKTTTSKAVPTTMAAGAPRTVPEIDADLDSVGAFRDQLVANAQQLLGSPLRSPGLERRLRALASQGNSAAQQILQELEHVNGVLG